MLKSFSILAVLCAPIAAQETVPLIERLADGTKIVVIDGIEHRALPPPKVAELAKQKAELEAIKQINAELGIQIKEALLQRDLAAAREALQVQKADSLQADFNRAREDSARWHGLFISERELRQEASRFVPHGSTSKFDKFLALFDNKYVLSGFKIGLPLIQTWRCQ